MPESTRPWLSIVTVVKDDPEGFARTADSLREPGPRRGRVGRHRQFARTPLRSRPAIDLPAAYAWSPPSGVYPAMNQGLTVASGDYVLFLNAGDELASTGHPRGDPTRPR